MTHATSSREGLAAALPCNCTPWKDGSHTTTCQSQYVDDLLDSGAVVDLVALADDDAVVDHVAAALAAQFQSWESLSRDGKDVCREDARAAIRALAEVVERDG